MNTRRIVLIGLNAAGALDLMLAMASDFSGAPLEEAHSAQLAAIPSQQALFQASRLSRPRTAFSIRYRRILRNPWSLPNRHFVWLGSSPRAMTNSPSFKSTKAPASE